MARGRRRRLGFRSLRLLRSLPPNSRGSNCRSTDSKLDSESEVVLTSSDSTGDPIWDAIRVEAKSEAEKEPILSSLLYASVLSHDCLERSLVFVLANRLQNLTFLSAQMMDIFDSVMMNDRSIQRAIRLDLQAFRDRDPACASYSWALLYLKGYHSLQSYRVAHALWKQGHKILALALQSRISEVFAVDIHPAAQIGEGILLDHGTGVVIGETAVVGNKVFMMQGVTLGGTGKQLGDRHPKVGQGALVGAGATILGNITVGEGAVIAAGSLVLKCVPPHSGGGGREACDSVQRFCPAMGLNWQLLTLLPEYSPPSWPAAIAGIFMLTSLSLSMFLIFEHLSAYKNPEEQKFLIGVILMVPCYAIESDHEKSLISFQHQEVYSR